MQTCPITMEEIRNPRALSCSHVFESEAIQQWLLTNNKCPLCRTEQTTEPQTERRYVERNQVIIVSELFTWKSLLERC